MRLNLYVGTVGLAVAILAASGCHSAQKPAKAIPPANPPALKAAPVTAQAATPKPAEPERREARDDELADLKAKLAELQEQIGKLGR